MVGKFSVLRGIDECSLRQFNLMPKWIYEGNKNAGVEIVVCCGKKGKNRNKITRQSNVMKKNLRFNKPFQGIFL
jgi:hypothetical protein